MAIYGYARCSTSESKQDIERQVGELKKAGAERVFYEYEHGDAIHKKVFETLFETMVEGDTIIVTEVSRMSRSTQQLCDILDKIQAQKLKLIILNSVTIDCSTGNPDPMTKAFLQMAGVFAELELSMIRSRVRSGMENARRKGKRIGRPEFSVDDIPANFYKYYALYTNGKINMTELARLSGISRTTAYKYINMLSNKQK